MKIIKYYDGTKINIFMIDYSNNKYYVFYINRNKYSYNKPNIYKFLKTKGTNIYKKNVWGRNALKIIRSEYKHSRDYLKRLYLINRFQNKVLYINKYFVAT